MSNVKPKDMAISSHPRALGLIVEVLREAFEGDPMPGYDRMHVGPLADALAWWVKPPRPFISKAGFEFTELVIADRWLRPVSGLPGMEICRDEATDKLQCLARAIKEMSG